MLHFFQSWFVTWTTQCLASHLIIIGINTLLFQLCKNTGSKTLHVDPKKLLEIEIRLLHCSYMMDWYSGVAVAHYITYLLRPIIMTAGPGRCCHIHLPTITLGSRFGQMSQLHISISTSYLLSQKPQGLSWKIKQFLLERPRQTHKLNFCFLNHYWDSATTL